jgi:hypothetical protein
MLYDIRPIWFQLPSGDFGALSQTLHKLCVDMESDMTSIDRPPDGVLRAREASRIAGMTAPPSGAASLAFSLMADRPAREAFFEHVTSSSWFAPLRDAGWLDPEPPEEGGDGRAARPWVQARFVARVARESPSDVVDFLRTLTTDNWLAYQAMPTILRELPDDDFWALGPRIAQWLQGAVVVHELVAEISRRVSQAERAREWTEVLSAMALRASDDSSYRLDALTSGPLAASALKAAAALDPTVIDLALDALDAYARRTWEDPGSEDSWASKRAIEESEPNERQAGLDWLAATTVDLFRAGRRRVRTRAALLRAFNNQWPLLNRIALFELSRSPSQRAKLCDDLIRRLPSFLQMWSVHRELSVLVAQLGRSARPCDKQVAASLFSSLELTTEASSASATYWHSVLNGSAPSESYFLFGRPEVFSVGAPMTVAEFTNRFGHLDADGLLRVVREPARHGIDLSWRADSELLWQTLAEFCEQERRSDVLLAATEGVLSAYGGSHYLIRSAPKMTAVDDHRSTQVLQHLEMLAQSSSDVVRSSALDAILDFRADGDTSESLVSTLLSVVKREGAAIHSSLDRGTVWEEGKPPDILMRQLNDAAGKAAQCLLQFFFNQRARRPADSAMEVPGWLWAFGEDPRWDLVECKVVLGQAFPFMVGASRARAEAIAVRLFSDGSPLLAREAFWAGYAWRTTPHRQTLEVLATGMRADCLSIPQFVHTKSDIHTQMMSHAAIGWAQRIAGYEPFPGAALQSPDPNVRETFVWASGRVIQGVTADFHDRLIEMFKELVAADSARPQSAWSGYLSWLGALGQLSSLRTVMPELTVLLAHVTDREVFRGLDMLKNAVSSDAREDVEQLADVFLRHAASMPDLRWHGESVVELLDAIVAGSGHVSRRVMLLVQDLLSREVLSLAQAERIRRLS